MGRGEPPVGRQHRDDHRSGQPRCGGRVELVPADPARRHRAGLAQHRHWSQSGGLGRLGHRKLRDDHLGRLDPAARSDPTACRHAVLPRGADRDGGPGVLPGRGAPAGDGASGVSGTQSRLREYGSALAGSTAVRVVSPDPGVVGRYAPIQPQPPWAGAVHFHHRQRPDRGGERVPRDTRRRLHSSCQCRDRGDTVGERHGRRRGRLAATRGRGLGRCAP